jgi:hypothetical protein
MISMEKTGPIYSHPASPVDIDRENIDRRKMISFYSVLRLTNRCINSTDDTADSDSRRR